MTRLEAERKARGLSQTALAAMAGKLGTSEISRFEHGMAIPYPPQAARLARVLGIKPDELLQPVTDPLPDRPRRVRKTAGARAASA